MSDLDEALAALGEAVLARTLADARIVELERERDRLRSALRALAEVFTMEPDPDRA